MQDSETSPSAHLAAGARTVMADIIESSRGNEGEVPCASCNGTQPAAHNPRGATSSFESATLTSRYRQPAAFGRFTWFFGNT